jgi:hypothetical protein
MPQFGAERNDYKQMSPLERAMADLSNKKPVLDGPGRDTFISENGEYFVMNRKVEAEDYDTFMDKYKSLVEHQIGQKEEELKQAA